MDGSLLARLPLERLTRPFGGSAPGGARSAGRAQGQPGVLDRMRGRGPRSIAAHRRLRIALMCLPVIVTLIGGGWLWLRHSSLASVEHVRVSGLHGPQAPAIEAALAQAARGMSTLDPNSSALRAAVARFPVVQRVRESAGFPHSMHIYVTERQPVAALVVAGLKTAVAADGVVLGPELLSSSLPTLTGAYEPARGQRLHNATLLEALTVLGAAPSALGRSVARVEEGPRGLTVAMQNGLLVYFGDAVRPHAKWLSLARVLADESSAGARYIDVRLPGRPAAGFSEATAAPASGEAAKSSESTVAALAAGLTGGKSEASAEPSEAASGTSAESSQTGESGQATGEAPPDEASAEVAQNSAEASTPEH